MAGPFIDVTQERAELHAVNDRQHASAMTLSAPSLVTKMRPTEATSRRPTVNSLGCNAPSGCSRLHCSADASRHSWAGAC